MVRPVPSLSPVSEFHSILPAARTSVYSRSRRPPEPWYPCTLTWRTRARVAGSKPFHVVRARS